MDYVIGGTPAWIWAAFIGAVILLLVLDLGVLHRKAHVVGFREAAAWSVAWVSLALAFGGGLFLWYPRGRVAALEFLAGYVVEESLSVDNLFVFLVIFRYFKTPPAYQHRVLFWGILGAIVMRGVFIGVGAVLIAKFHWILYLFGALLVFTAFKLFFADDEGIDPARNPLLRLARRFFPVTPDYVGQKLFVRGERGRLTATPLVLVLIVVETTDLVFAVDSIPAIFGFTQDPFIVFTSNIMAILGLRALYFLLAGMMDKFRYLRPGLAFVLGFVGLKMLGEHYVKVGIGTSLGIVGGILATAVAASLLIHTKDTTTKQHDGGLATEGAEDAENNSKTNK